MFCKGVDTRVRAFEGDANRARDVFPPKRMVIERNFFHRLEAIFRAHFIDVVESWRAEDNRAGHEIFFGHTGEIFWIGFAFGDGDVGGGFNEFLELLVTNSSVLSIQNPSMVSS